LITILKYVQLRSLGLRAPKAGILFIILILLVWLVAGLVANTVPTETQRSFSEQVSVSTDPIFLDLGRTKIAIPRNHLNSLWFDHNDRKLASVLAVVVYPGFEGATARNIASILRPKGFSIGAVYFNNTLEGSVVLNDDDSWKRRPWYRGPDIELEPAEFGLLRPRGSDAGLHIWLGTTDGETVSVGCGGGRRVCQIFFFAEGWAWRVLMGAHLHPHWQDVTNKLRELIAEWVAAAKDGKK